MGVSRLSLRECLRYVAGICLILFTLFLGATPAWGATYAMPPKGSDVIGQVQVVRAWGSETLAQIGRRHGMGLMEMQRANRHLSHRRTLPRGARVVIPAQFILPPGKREGLVVNLAEMRLYYFPKGRHVVITEAVGIGRVGEEWRTPQGETTIVDKVKNPYWRPTAAVRAEAARNGTPIPRVFPPGPENPLGRHMMRLGWRTYLIHSTNRPEGVGARVSAGCLRMYPESIAKLFHKIPVGTKVRVINEPFKIGWAGPQLVMESHIPLVEDMKHYDYDLAPVLNVVRRATAKRPARVNWRSAQYSAQQPSGIPRVIGVAKRPAKPAEKEIKQAEHKTSHDQI